MLEETYATLPGMRVRLTTHRYTDMKPCMYPLSILLLWKGTPLNRPPEWMVQTAGLWVLLLLVRFFAV